MSLEHFVGTIIIGDYKRKGDYMDRGGEEVYGQRRSN